MTTKSPTNVTVRKASEIVFDEMPEIFTAIDFCRRVRAITGRPALMDGSILRRLREARADSLRRQYRCIDQDTATYMKEKIL